MVELHDDLKPLARLVGSWAGEGEGHYPTIESFTYREEISFNHVGKPFLSYRQATVNLNTGVPAHAEAGYLRPVAADRVELVLAHPTGIAEVAEGTVMTEPSEGGLSLHLKTITVATTTTAKVVTSIERSVEVRGDTLHYDLYMAAVGQPHQHHLAATLHRV